MGEYSKSCFYDSFGNVKESTQNGCKYEYLYEINAAHDIASMSVEGITVTPKTDMLGNSKRMWRSVRSRKRCILTRGTDCSCSAQKIASDV